MARLTVEDCITRIPNRFELVMLAAQRSRDIGSGAVLTVERDNDKNPVVALREIAEGTIEPEKLHQELIQSLRRGPEIDEPEEDVITLLTAEQAWAGVTGESRDDTVDAAAAAAAAMAAEASGEKQGDTEPDPELAAALAADGPAPEGE